MLISDIKPYERNARHNDKAIPKVAESIRKFGLRGSIVLESRDNPVIVCGHTRVAAAKSLGWTEIPDDHIEYCDGLTQDEIDAFRLIDNKTGEIATWNVALLKSEAKRLNGKLDFARYGFDFKSKVKPYGAERARTDDYYNLRLCDIDDCGPDGMPLLAPTDIRPARLIGFNYAKSWNEPKTGVGITSSSTTTSSNASGTSPRNTRACSPRSTWHARRTGASTSTCPGRCSNGTSTAPAPSATGGSAKAWPSCRPCHGATRTATNTASTACPPAPPSP